MIGVIEMPHNYAIVIFYSDEDEGFIAVVPELPGCSAFGEIEEEALQEAKVAIDLWLDTAREEGREIPEPSGREHLREILAGGCCPRGDGIDPFFALASTYAIKRS
ncbi:type II toxin-antitoxin system HicB family antitoxin [Methanoculleus sp.]|uniref:type II toxin-antitoxin system HicB family antitoxin n=1 Tax=Methanoculleus sp. TaxID=90427 RepID=UPI0026099B20|nr:type II toxin-antitoxin system HicB family antitoxin [Methanoculleus sp.]